MQNLPTAEVYEKEFKYMPWGILMKELQEIVVRDAPKDASILDLLCGPGYLLGQLQKYRSDLKLTGVDLEPEFIEYAKNRYQGIDFITADVTDWQPKHQYDVILCTGGLHHLRYEQQASFLRKISILMKDGGFAIIADPYIEDYSDEESRKLAGARLGYEYLAATIRNGATSDVIEAAVGILLNDVLLIEFKNSVKKMEPLFAEHFTKVKMHKTWPEVESTYGDYYFLLKK